MFVNYEIDGNLAIKVADLKKMLFATVNEFTEKSVLQFKTDLNAMVENQQEFYPIIIDSYGGYVHSLISMVDMIQNLQKPVVTIALGKAMSCGSVLLACGTKGYRYAANSSRIMIHDVSGIAFGKESEVAASAKEITFLQDWLFNLLDEKAERKNDYF